MPPSVFARGILCVTFLGEDGIDTGALALEFLTNTMDQIRKKMFPYGYPSNTMLNVHNQTLKACGQIAAVSIAQGGPAPCILDNVSYELY